MHEYTTRRRRSIDGRWLLHAHQLLFTMCQNIQKGQILPRSVRTCVLGSKSSHARLLVPYAPTVWGFSITSDGMLSRLTLVPWLSITVEYLSIDPILHQNVLFDPQGATKGSHWYRGMACSHEDNRTYAICSRHVSCDG
jgi:hypothetical protein